VTLTRPPPKGPGPLPRRDPECGPTLCQKIAIVALLPTFTCIAVAACAWTARDLDAFSRVAAPISSAVVAVAPVVDTALGAYADAAREAQRRADLAPTSPDALALRDALARLAAADARVAAAQRPVACVEPVGTVAPAPAVDVDALAAAIDARIAATLDAREALVKTKRKRAKDAGTEGGQ
jgi:hypothetical protein